MVFWISSSISPWEEVPNGSDRVGYVLPLDIGCGSMHTVSISIIRAERSRADIRLAHDKVVACVDGRDQTERTDQRSGTISAPKSELKELKEATRTKETYEMISPYRFGATATSKILFPISSRLTQSSGSPRTLAP